jgi:hypothetical protein
MRSQGSRLGNCLEWPATEMLPFTKALLEGVRVDWDVYVGFGHGG